MHAAAQSLRAGAQLLDSTPFATNRRWFDDQYKIGIAIGVNIDQIGFAK
jgi:hypothetical protein